ncbi:MAG: ATP-dependent Clp protease ATP-binding subunit ClpC, partial [Prochlorococcus sp.]
DQDFTKAGELREKEVELREKIRTLLQSSRQNSEEQSPTETAAVDSSTQENPTAQTENDTATTTTTDQLTTPLVKEEDIANIVASWTGVPVQKLTESESVKLLNMEDTLHQRLIGQDEAVKAVSKAIRRA